MTPDPAALIALQLALWSLMLELWGIDPATLLRTAADMLEESEK